MKLELKVGELQKLQLTYTVLHGVEQRPLREKETALCCLIPTALWVLLVGIALCPYAVRQMPGVGPETVSGYTCRGLLEREKTNEWWRTQLTRGVSVSLHSERRRRPCDKR